MAPFGFFPSVSLLRVGSVVLIARDPTRPASSGKPSSPGLSSADSHRALDIVAFPFKRITSQYLASLFRSRRARATLPADL